MGRYEHRSCVARENRLKTRFQSVIKLDILSWLGSAHGGGGGSLRCTHVYDNVRGVVLECEKNWIRDVDAYIHIQFYLYLFPPNRVIIINLIIIIVYIVNYVYLILKQYTNNRLTKPSRMEDMALSRIQQICDTIIPPYGKTK